MTTLKYLPNVSTLFRQLKKRYTEHNKQVVQKLYAMSEQELIYRLSRRSRDLDSDELRIAAKILARRMSRRIPLA